jgi:hypothetical protein
MSWQSSSVLALVLIVAAPACSDDTSGPTPDSKVGPDSCCGPADGRVDVPLADLPPPGPDSCCAPDVPVVDLPPPGPDSCCAPDLPPPVPDLSGNKKLIIWAQCSTITKCQPYCGAIGSKSEGWYDGCTNKMLNDPFTGSPYWDQCIKCVVICDAVGSKSEGWYAQCP